MNKETQDILWKIKDIIDGTEELSPGRVDWQQALINDAALTEIINLVESEITNENRRSIARGS